MTPLRRSILMFVLAGGAVVLLVSVVWHRRPASKPGDMSSVSTEPHRTPSATSEFRAATNEPATAAHSNPAATVENIRRLLGSVEPVLPGEVENAAALKLLRWWAEIDPVAAIEYAAGNPNVHGRPTLPVELFVSWLDVKHADALKWIQGLKTGDLRSQILPAVISIVAQQHPMEALRMAAELRGENRRTALSALFSEWSAIDPRAAAAEAMRLVDAREQNLALRHVLGKWMDSNPESAIAWAKSLPPQPAPDSLDVSPAVTGILIEKWAARAPAEAAAYLLSTPDAAGRIHLLRTVAGQWAGANPTQAIAWAAGIPSESERTLMVRGVLATVAQTSVQSAAELAMTLRDPIVLEQGLAMVIDQWIARDPAAVAAWTSAIVERPASQAMLAPVVTTWAAADLASLGRWLNTLPAGDARDACCAALAQFLAPRQPALAMRWAETISNPALRRQQLGALAPARE